METQRFSEEQLLDQQFNDLFLELNQDTQDKYFNCQEKFKTFAEECILTTLY